MINFMHQLHYTQRKTSWYPLKWSLKGPQGQSGHWRREISLVPAENQTPITQLFSRSPVTILTELFKFNAKIYRSIVFIHVLCWLVCGLFKFTVSSYLYQMRQKIIMYNELERWSREKADIAYLQLLSHYTGICLGTPMGSK
jgi:hypothetical protein